MAVKHFNRETILRHLDGELCLGEAKKVAAHLRSCWKCRSEAAQMEEVIQKAAQAFAELPVSDFHAVVVARDRFQQECRKWDLRESHQRSATPLAVPFNSSKATWIWFAGAASLVLCLYVGVLALHRRPSLALRQIHQARQYERREFHEPAIYEQTFSIRFRQERPEQQESQGQVVLWSEASSPRAASQWRTDAGTVRYAVWRPDADHRYILDPALSPAPKQSQPARRSSITLAQLGNSGASLARVQQAFAWWLENRDCEPFSFAREMDDFASGPEVSLNLERDPQSGFAKVVATRSSGDCRISLILVSSGATGKPELESLRFETPWHTVVVDIRPRDTRRLGVAQASLSVFAPAAEPEPLPANTFPAHGTARIAPKSNAPKIRAGFSSDVLTTAEMQVRYALHLARACTGTGLTVQIAANGSGVMVQGVVETATYRDELSKALHSLDTPVPVQIGIATEEEVNSTIPLRSSARSIAAPAAGPSTHLDSAKTLPIESLIDASALSEDDRVRMRKEIAAVANQALSSGESALADAWALREIAGIRSGRTMSVEARRLLELMADDHIPNLENTIRTLRSSITRFFGPLMPTLFDRDANAPSPGADWLATASLLPSTAGEMQSHLIGLFTLGNNPGSEPRSTAVQLLEALERIERTIDQCKTQFENSKRI